MGEGGSAVPGTPRWLLIATGVAGLVASLFVVGAKYYELRKSRAEAIHAQSDEAEKQPSPPPDRKSDVRTAETVVPLREAGKAEVLSGIYNVSGHQGPGAPPLTSAGAILKRPIMLHPPVNGKGAVRLTLEQRYRLFRSTVCIGDSGPRQSATPITFVLLADGEPKWTSRPLQVAGASEQCEVSIEGARTLELQTHCPGADAGAWSIWVDPVLVR